VVAAALKQPLMISPDGSARFLPVEGDTALGVSAMTKYTGHRCPVPGGSTLVLYTDGVVEVRGESIDEGLERMRLLAERHADDSVETLCDTMISELVADGRPSDDVALLIVRVIRLGDQLHETWPARASSLVDVRHLLRRWLRHHGAADEAAYDITVACQEACANAVEHAYAPGGEAFEVDASRTGREIEIAIRDHGQWRRARGAHRGRGMPMMEALMDSVHVEHTADGTVVVLRRTLAGGDDA